VEVDCRHIFQPGQLAVAMGRVKSEEGLRVVNFSPNAVLQQPTALGEFLEKKIKGHLYVITMNPLALMHYYLVWTNIRRRGTYKLFM